MVMDRIVDVALGKGNTPKGLLKDKHSKELAYPNIFAGQPQDVERITIRELSEWNLQSTDRRVVKDPQYQFYLFRKNQIHR